MSMNMTRTCTRPRTRGVALGAVEDNRAVREGAVHARRPRVVLHHEGRIDEREAQSTPNGQPREPHTEDGVANRPAAKVGLTRTTFARQRCANARRLV